jgi:hypothetical protein
VSSKRELDHIRYCGVPSHKIVSDTSCNTATQPGNWPRDTTPQCASARGQKQKMSAGKVRHSSLTAAVR